MNLYFRLLLVLLRCPFARKIGVLQESRMNYRVWPLDCDINLHLTNARYLALCDLSRIYYMGQVGVLFQMVRRNWLPVVQAQEISYFKPIKPFQQLQVVTRFTHWDDKYWYTEHRFLAAGRLSAVVQVRGVVVQRRKVLPFGNVVALADADVKVPAKPIAVEQWQKLIECKTPPRQA